MVLVRAARARVVAQTVAAATGREMTLEPDRTYFVAYWPAEGGAAPLRLGPDDALAVWESRDAAEMYGLRTRAVLQLVETSAARLGTAGPLVLNPVL